MRYDDKSKRKKNRCGGRSGPFVLCRKEYMKKAFVLLKYVLIYVFRC